MLSKKLYFGQQCPHTEDGFHVINDGLMGDMAEVFKQVAVVAEIVITGMGFIGAGAIMKEVLSIHGITTSASLWVASAVGMMVGANALILAIITTLIALITLIFPESTLKKM